MAALAGLLVFYLLIGVAIGGGIGYAIGNGKGRGAAGFWLGAILGVLGWIIVAVMEPTDQVRRQRQAETFATAAAVMGQVPGGSTGAPGQTPSVTRECPWCAETIRAAAKVCRFCNREVEPLETVSPELVTQQRDASFECVRAEFPAQFADAFACLKRLDPQPERPPEWVRELCNRLSNGSPLELAAKRIPLDWSGPLPVITAPPRPLPTLPGPVDASVHEAIRAAHPGSYDTARTLLDDLESPPFNPPAWLDELCTRIEAGSPPKAAASRIPLDWQSRGQAQ
jgi:hypothetical protein